MHIRLLLCLLSLTLFQGCGMVSSDMGAGYFFIVIGSIAFIAAIIGLFYMLFSKGGGEDKIQSAIFIAIGFGLLMTFIG